MKNNVINFFIWKNLKNENKSLCSEESKAHVEHMHIQTVKQQ